MATTIQEQLDQSLELLNGQVKFMESLHAVLVNQVLCNADQLESVTRETEGLSQEARIRLLTIVNDFIKGPIRKQNGRLMSHLEAVRSAQQKIKRAVEMAQPAQEK